LRTEQFEQEMKSTLEDCMPDITEGIQNIYRAGYLRGYSVAQAEQDNLTELSYRTGFDAGVKRAVEAGKKSACKQSSVKHSYEDGILDAWKAMVGILGLELNSTYSNAFLRVVFDGRSREEILNMNPVEVVQRIRVARETRGCVKVSGQFNHSFTH